LNSLLCLNLYIKNSNQGKWKQLTLRKFILSQNRKNFLKIVGRLNSLRREITPGKVDLDQTAAGTGLNFGWTTIAIVTSG
jgi:hypothetical protein